MPCLHPISIRNPRYVSWKKNMSPDVYVDTMVECFGTIHPKDEYLSVPCGHCYQCRKRKAKEWRLRLLWENTRHHNAIFITLTFSDKYRKEAEENPRIFVRRYLDLLRKYTNHGKYLKHWFITEHGDSEKYTGRIHLHGIIWDVDKYSTPFKTLHEKWQYGNVWIGWCNARTCNYITKYLLKHKESEHVPLDEKQYIVCSNGIGENYISDKTYYKHHQDQYKYAFICYAPDQNHRYPMPQYYKTKLFSLEDRIEMYHVLDPPDIYYLNGVTYYDFIEYSKALRLEWLSTLSSGLSFVPPKKQTVLPILSREELLRQEGIYQIPFNVQLNLF